jgi:hypothetical protein
MGVWSPVVGYWNWTLAAWPGITQQQEARSQIPLEFEYRISNPPKAEMMKYFFLRHFRLRRIRCSAVLCFLKSIYET